jgi:hypothetical protein
MYSNDMVIDKRFTWAKENSFDLNRGKTMQTVFRKGSQVSDKDSTRLESNALNVVNSYRYLGVHPQTTRASFRNQGKRFGSG